MFLKKIFLYDRVMAFGEKYPLIKPFLPCFFFIKKTAKKYFVTKRLYFEITATEHCNLQCAMCSHYSPLAEKSYLDIEEMVRDLRRMNELFKDYELTCCILGGEPLLHPEIDRIMSSCRSTLPTAHLQLCTNGILLKNMENSFWAALRENDIELIISAYPITLDYKLIEQKAQENGIKKFERNNAVVDGFTKNIIQPKPGNKRRNSIMCDAHHRSHTLSHGKLYTCHCSANIHLFNHYFRTNYPEDNGVDIYTVETGEALLSKMEEPCSLCAYCRPDKYVVKPWRRSKKEINEWLD